MDLYNNLLGRFVMNYKMKDLLGYILIRLCLPSIVALAIWLGVQCCYQLVSPLSVLLNIEGTLLLAFAIVFPEGPNRFRWLLYESAKYGSTPSFSYLNFYLGLIAIMAGILIGAIK
jgi:heme/copper-type cytochrome/quinol oxidase subunit 1